MTKESLPAEDSDGHSQRRRRVYKLNIFLMSRLSDPPKTHISWGGYFVTRMESGSFYRILPSAVMAHINTNAMLFFTL